MDAMAENYFTPLHFAAQNGHEVVAKLLLESGKKTANICVVK